MLSIIVSSKNTEKLKDKILSIFRENKVGSSDLLINEFDNLGIADVRLLSKKAFMSPAGETLGLGVIINSAVTLDAQNALLKTLEEPPEKTLIILGVKNKDLLLPTILSRCKLIEVKNEKEGKGETKILEVYSLSNGEKLKLAQDFSKTKEDALNFLEESQIALREKILNKPEKRDLKLIKKLQQVYIQISTTNVSPRFAIENFLLSS